MQTLAYVLLVAIVIWMFQIWCNNIVQSNANLKLLRSDARRACQVYPARVQTSDHIHLLVYDRTKGDTLYHTKEFEDPVTQEHADTELKSIGEGLHAGSNPIFKHVPELNATVGHTIALCKIEDDSVVALAYTQM